MNNQVEINGVALQEDKRKLQQMQNAKLLSFNTHMPGTNAVLRGLAMIMFDFIICNGGSIPSHAAFEALANLSPNELQKVESKTESELKEFGTSKLEGSLPSCKDGNKGLSDRNGKIDIMAAIRYLINKNYIRRDVEKQGEAGQALILYSLGPRALAEVGRGQVITHVANVLGHNVDDALMEEVRESDRNIFGDAVMNDLEAN